MAFMLLVSSTGFSIDLHYCQGDIKSFSLFGTAKSCHTKANKSHCSKNKMSCHFAKTALEKVDDSGKSCCSNKSIEIAPDLDIDKVLSEQLTQTQITIISAYVAAFFTDQPSDLAKLDIPHKKYIPPLLDRDIPVLVQSFLI